MARVVDVGVCSSLRHGWRVDEGGSPFPCFFGAQCKMMGGDEDEDSINPAHCHESDVVRVVSGGCLLVTKAW